MIAAGPLSPSRPIFGYPSGPMKRPTGPLSSVVCTVASIAAVGVVVVVLLASVAAAPALAQSPAVLAGVAKEVNEGKAVLVDVRSDREWASGHLAKAMSMPVDQIAAGKADLTRLPKDRPVYIHCSVGARSAYAARALRPKGYDARPLDAGPVQLVAAGFSPAK